MARYFFDTDEDSHWYMIPERLREEWQDSKNERDDEVDIEDFDELFECYRTYGGISGFTFTDPVRSY